MEKIVIIKLGALGDVIRTLPILEGLKEKFGEIEVTWITRGVAAEILRKQPNIHSVLTTPVKPSEEFDRLYNFDIDFEATTLAKSIKSKKKYGYYIKQKYPQAFNISAEYYLNTVFDDELKRTNKKTYQEVMFETAELEYKKQMPKIYVTQKFQQYAQNFFSEMKDDKKKIIGIHLGASSRWPSKTWAENQVKQFIIEIKKKGYEVLLFGGPNEIIKHSLIISELERKQIKVLHNDPNNSLEEFASLVNLCYLIVCSDSLALHVSLALEKKTIALFFCTSPDEVEGYGLLKKVVSPFLYDFFPEKMDLYDEKLVNSIEAKKVVKIIEELENKKE